MSEKSVVLKEKIEACEEFFNRLSEELWYCYEVVGSCNQDISRYLVPFGTEEQITYYSKPVLSFRISDHWNWFSNLKKCKDAHYVQCMSYNMPWTRERTAPGMASKPQFGIMVAVCDKNGLYHNVYGERFDRKSHRWFWVENTPSKIIKQWLI